MTESTILSLYGRRRKAHFYSLFCAIEIYAIDKPVDLLDLSIWKMWGIIWEFFPSPRLSPMVSYKSNNSEQYQNRSLYCLDIKNFFQ